MLQIITEEFGKGKVISPHQMRVLSDEISLALLPRDSITKMVNFTRKFKVTLGSKTEWNDSTLDLLLRDSTIKWYTDGSKTINTHTIKKLLRNEESVDGKKYLQQLQGKRTAKLLMGGYNLTGFENVTNLMKDKFRILISFYTGHYKLKKHLFNMGLAFCENCRLCDM